MPRCVADAARQESYKKGVFNQLLTHLSVYYAKEAVCGTVSVATWSKAAAIYGNSIADVASHPATPHATANKRCKNYDTCVTNAVNQGATDGTLPALNYQSATNVAIMNAFLEATAANVEIVMEQIKVTYIQAALRYLNKLDKNLIADPVQPVSTACRRCRLCCVFTPLAVLLQVFENQGEGWAFALVAKPYLSAGTFAVIEGLYTPLIDVTGASAT